MHCKSLSHFFIKKFQHICVSLDVNFNESLTNDVVSFEQLGPDNVPVFDIMHIFFQGAEPDITSYNRVMCACVDYLFYSSSSLDNVGILQTASKDKIMETGGTPNCYFPSDHVSMKAVFSFR